jgi:hypothetical protein
MAENRAVELYKRAIFSDDQVTKKVPPCSQPAKRLLPPHSLVRRVFFVRLRVDDRTDEQGRVDGGRRRAPMVQGRR